MNGAEQVSVVMPVFDPGPYLAPALASVFAQQGVTLELIVVDDGSNEAVARVLEPYRANVRYVEQPNRGPAAARNQGVALASAPYVAFLDADDLWPASWLEDALRALSEHAELAAVHGLTQLLVATECEHASEPRAGFRPEGEPWRSPQLGSVLVRRAVAAKFPFDETLRRGEDLDWFARLRHARVRIETLDELAVLYRIHARNTTRGASTDERNTFEVLKRALERRRTERSA